MAYVVLKFRIIYKTVCQFTDVKYSRHIVTFCLSRALLCCTLPRLLYDWFGLVYSKKIEIVIQTRFNVGLYGASNSSGLYFYFIGTKLMPNKMTLSIQRAKTIWAVYKMDSPCYHVILIIKNFIDLYTNTIFLPVLGFSFHCHRFSYWF